MGKFCIDYSLTNLQDPSAKLSYRRSDFKVLLSQQAKSSRVLVILVSGLALAPVMSGHLETVYSSSRAYHAQIKWPHFISEAHKKSPLNGPLSRGRNIKLFYSFQYVCICRMRERMIQLPRHAANTCKGFSTPFLSDQT